MFTNNDIKRGMINTIEKKTIKKNININSLFRELELINSCNNYKQCGKTELVTLDYTQSKWNSSNFFIWLPTPLENVINMTLRSLELPHTFYTFSSELKTNVFTIIDNTTNEEYVIELIPGNYTASELISQINYCIEKIPDLSEKIEFSRDTITGKCYIYSLNTEDPFDFDIDFNLPSDEERDIFLNLGWILGFRKGYYTYSNDYLINDSSDMINLGNNQKTSDFVNQNYQNSNIIFNFNSDTTLTSPTPVFPQGFISEGIIDTSGPKYLFLLATDFTKGQHDNYTSLVSKNTHIPCSDILARINIPTIRNQIGFTNLSDFIPRKREYFGPVKIEKIHFKVVDEFGRIINLNNNDISLLLEFEISYSNNY